MENTVETTARNSGLQDLVTMLQEQHVRKVDMVVPASALASVNGQVQVTDTILSDDGVTSAGQTFTPTSVFDEGISDKLGIPLKYVRTLRAERPDLMDANVT